MNQKLSVTEVAEVIYISVMITILFSITIFRYHIRLLPSLCMVQPHLEVRINAHFDWYLEKLRKCVRKNILIDYLNVHNSARPIDTLPSAKMCFYETGEHPDIYYG